MDDFLKGMETVEEVELTKTLVGIDKAVSMLELSQMKVDIHRHPCLDAMLVSVRAYFDTEEVDSEDVTFVWAVYESWWDHFKDWHMPKWFTKRWPVRWKDCSQTIKVKHSCVFPKITKLPEYKSLKFRRDVNPKRWER